MDVSRLRGSASAACASRPAPPSGVNKYMYIYIWMSHVCVVVHLRPAPVGLRHQVVYIHILYRCRTSAW